jgi:hypothetical protein
MESPQFVGCSWFIGLIGLVSDSPEIKATENRLCAISRPSPVSSSTHLDAPGVAIATIPDHRTLIHISYRSTQLTPHSPTL